MPDAKQQARTLIEQASKLIQAGNPQVALENLHQSILYNPKDAEAYILLGVALAQTGSAVDAENAFKKAIRVNPNSAKAYYNLGVHQYAQEQRFNAVESLRKALQVQPSHQGSATLLERIETELGADMPSREAAIRAAPAGRSPEPVAPRAGYEEEAGAAIPFVEAMGAPWTLIGWGLALLSLLGFVLMIGLLLPNIQSGNFNEAGIARLETAAGYRAIQVMHLSSLVGGLLWIILDLLNRRTNLIWMIPQGLCGCFGFAWLTLPLYLMFGRKNGGNQSA